MKKGTTIKIATAAASVLLLGSEASAFTLTKKVGDIDTKLKLYGFSQLEARGGEGVLGDDSNAVAQFGAQRVRLGANYTAGKVRGKLFLDFNQPYDAGKDEAGLPKVIKDAFVTYFENKALAVKVGLIKMPHGMGFTIPGWNLDVVERGFDKRLAMERNTGIMISGRDLGFGNNGKVTGFEMGHEVPWKGFGYDVQIANQAGRSGAVVNAVPGNANSYAGRVMFDWTEIFHTELSYAVSQNAGGIEGQVVNGTPLAEDTEDYQSLNFGIDSHFGPSNVKFEMYNSDNVRGEKGFNTSTYAFTGTHYVTDTLELALKHIQGHNVRNSETTDLGNTYVGFNFYPEAFDNKMDRSSKRKRNAHRMQFNYVLASGDTDGDKVWNGLGGFKDDAWLFQYQYKF